MNNIVISSQIVFSVILVGRVSIERVCIVDNEARPGTCKLVKLRRNIEVEVCHFHINW